MKHSLIHIQPIPVCIPEEEYKIDAKTLDKVIDLNNLNLKERSRDNDKYYNSQNVVLLNTYIFNSNIN